MHLELYPPAYLLKNTLLSFLEIPKSQDIQRNINCLNGSSYHKEMMAKYLHAWYEFVPHQDAVSNCWYAQNFNSLPGHIRKKMKELATFVDAPAQFANETEMILANIFKYGNKTLFSSYPTNHFFCLPRSFLIGFPKCGTTLLYEYIQSHPLFANPQVKEGQFWREFVKTSKHQSRELEILLYLFHFSDAAHKIRRNPRMFTIDASASTVFAASQPLQNVEEDMCFVPLLIRKTLPNSKFIIIMRNPIDRLWSDFWYFCPPSKWSSYNIQENAAAEIFHNQTLKALKDFNDCVSSNYTFFYCITVSGSISGEEAACNSLRLGLSIYYPHILRWSSVFPKKQLLLIRIEDLISDSAKTMNLVWTFLEVPLHNRRIIKERVNSNLWITKGKYNFQMLLTTKIILKQFFSAHNRMLARLLDDERYLWND